MTLDYFLIQLIEYALEKHLIKENQINNAKNNLSMIFKDYVFEYVKTERELSFLEMIEPLLNFAYSKELFEPNTSSERDAFEAKIMDAMMPSPKEVKETFAHYYLKSSDLATSYLFELSKNVNYIKTLRLKENISWLYKGLYGDLQMTINLAKPEKDPKEIANALNKPVVQELNKPLCVLCKENEQNYYNARMNLRIVPILLGGEIWHFQYSPYQYYNEHAIILHDAHRPMKISNQTFEYLLDFVDMFPSYFIGSNADIPIVGGSILNHDHFQAGKHHFPIEDAKVIKSYQWHNDVLVFHVKWPLSTIRLQSKSRDKLSLLASLFLKEWRAYNHLKLDIISHTGDIPHNTITPILRKDQETYTMDLVLRNNRTSDKYPDGIFHPHQDVHHIKKENIGLIEAMGLAILPGRLKTELELIKMHLVNDAPLSSELIKHQLWINELKKISPMTDDILLAEVGKKFERVIEDSGVFKLNHEGNEAIHQLIEQTIKN
ncbi:MAG: galactose-1-phosphate uridylyltransferase [Tenericutes bacterium HGW-Tenericutes-3]|nr:MAG: galactose-1-phosphate uridylyltransferase [Tenericutes bacterium HGW-Tenericutes-3]